MPHINLLPWREKQRERYLKIYQGLLGGVAFLSLAIMFGLSTFMNQLIEGQTGRNNFLSQQIAILDQQIAMIKTIKEKRQALQLKINLIQQLQDSRNLTTQILSEIALVVPPGVYLERLKRDGSKIRIEGKSESNNRLSEMMRRIESSELLENPAIESIVAAERTQRPVSNFIMSLRINFAEPNASDSQGGKS